MIEIDTEKLSQITALRAGKGGSLEEGLCLMEAVAYVTGVRA